MRRRLAGFARERTAPAGAGGRSSVTRDLATLGSWQRGPATTSSPAVIASRMTARQGPGKPMPRGAMPISSASSRSARFRASERTIGASCSKPSTWPRVWPADLNRSPPPPELVIAQQADGGFELKTSRAPSRGRRSWRWLE